MTSNRWKRIGRLLNCFIACNFLVLEYGKGQNRLPCVCRPVFVLLNKLEGCEFVQTNQETEPREEQQCPKIWRQMEVIYKKFTIWNSCLVPTQQYWLNLWHVNWKQFLGCGHYRMYPLCLLYGLKKGNVRVCVAFLNENQGLLLIS